MREIKFRAWNTKEKVMGTPFTIREAFYFNSEAYINPEELLIMQFTGLKDKNGKEIYEGDLIKNEDGDIKEVYLDEDGHFYPFGNGDFSWLYLYSSIEVIGNIYENPDIVLNEGLMI